MVIRRAHMLGKSVVWVFRKIIKGLVFIVTKIIGGTR
jgi:hypothetical protein